MEIFEMLSQATPVVKGVLILLVIMSLGSWSLMVYKFFSLRTVHKNTVETLTGFSGAKNLGAAIRSLNTQQMSPVYYVARQGVTEYIRLRENNNSDDILYDNVRRSLRLGVSEAVSSLGKSLSFLATCANTAPFIGLFGTVWGIMHSFHNIGQSGKASLATVAPGISEALIATALGLFVAIPASVGYNAFLNRMSQIEVELTNFGRVFLNRVKSEVDLSSNGSTYSAQRPAQGQKL